MYSEVAMNAGNVRKRCGLFEEGKTNMPHEKRSERSSSTIGEIFEHPPCNTDFAHQVILSLVSPTQEIFGRPESEE